MTITTYQLQTLTCPSCVNHIEKALGSLTGVEDAKVSFNSSKVKVTHSEDIDADEVRKTIEKLGYEVLDEK